jgi:hypothetical protein
MFLYVVSLTVGLLSVHVDVVYVVDYDSACFSFDETPLCTLLWVNPGCSWWASTVKQMFHVKLIVGFVMMVVDSLHIC